jgi:hypothetical protein
MRRYEIKRAVKTLPASFIRQVRNLYRKCNTHHNIYEWMAVLHYFIIPIAWELEFDEYVLENFLEFVNIVEVAMSHTSECNDDFATLYAQAISFLQGLERLYAHSHPTIVSRCGLYIRQLIHVPTPIAWNGSIIFGSQATVERAIGKIGHKVRSRKAPFANITTMIFEKGKIIRCSLKYPS